MFFGITATISTVFTFYYIHDINNKTLDILTQSLVLGTLSDYLVLVDLYRVINRIFTLKEQKEMAKIEKKFRIV